MAKRLERHPLSAIWGDMPEGEYAALVESVRQEGILDYVIKTLDDQVLDGWHRYQAAQGAGVEHQLMLTPYLGDDPVSFVIRRNAHRRHLTAGRRAQMIVGCREWAKTGRPLKGADSAPFSAERINNPDATVAEMAVEAGTSERSIQTAKVIEEAGLGDAVRSGDMPVQKAAHQAAGGPEPPKEPTKAQRLDAERDALALDVQEKATRIDEMEDEVRFHEGNMNEQEHERHKAFTAVRAELSTALSQNNEHMVKANEDARSLRYWKREAKKPCRNCGTEWEFTND